MKILVVYYSLEGNTKLIAESIAKSVNGDILELKPEKDISPKGFSRFLWGGKQVVLKEKPPLKPLDKNAMEYDLIFFGSPVWAGSFAPAFNSFFNSISIKGKKVAMFCCYAGSAGKTFEKFKKALEGNKFVGEIGFKDPLKNDKKAATNEASKWANSKLLNELK